MLDPTYESRGKIHVIEQSRGTRQHAAMAGGGGWKDAGSGAKGRRVGRWTGRGAISSREGGEVGVLYRVQKGGEVGVLYRVQKGG